MLYNPMWYRSNALLRLQCVRYVLEEVLNTTMEIQYGCYLQCKVHIGLKPEH